MEKNISIAVDGPAGAGKSTISKLLAKQLEFIYIDTGAMYRAITYKALKLGIDTQDETMYEFIDDTSITLTKDNRVLVDEHEVTEEIRSTEISNNVSIVSSIKTVREKLVSLQRNIAEKNHVVMDGRDIGTNVLPNADVKFYLNASVDVRAKRRYLENSKKGIESNFEQIKQDIIKRDYLDSTRELNPLRKADDAIEVDTSALSIDEVVNKLIVIIKRKVEQ
ncbi:(d)CMP kinase [Haloplasma contractile]|uniref:Cytidylate kinase n=1 Tax=Haloplasma contractile SSD-17B TaxID=1033810 RepID=F7PVN0_9MOLU|nr:(d)CMP kinase [Haloplasma contractile]ERJ12802.1 Cytidylate kinase protein [Haloplasma contractile SSD-17B]